MPIRAKICMQIPDLIWWPLPLLIFLAAYRPHHPNSKFKSGSDDMGQDAISALFGTDEPAADPAATSDTIETKSYDSVEDDLADVDLPEINMVQHSYDETEPELSNFDDFDTEDDIDPDLIESILEGKDEDPAV
jgi:hypothetical protein